MHPDFCKNLRKYPYKQHFFYRLAFICIQYLIAGSHLSAQEKKVVIGYVGGFNGLVNAAHIDASKLTHINYAFVDIKGNQAWLHNEKTDTVNFRVLNTLKKNNPSLKILISIGGWSWSENFSDATFTDSSRKAFALSSVRILQNHNLDGVDIDWEYPGIPGEDGNVFRAEDKENYTLMFKEIRQALNELEKITQKKYLLTTAVGGFDKYIQHTEMGKAAAYLDYVNLMTYDYSFGVSGHHSNLYNTTDDEKENSAHKAVTAYMAAGVPANKIVMGIPFYGRGGIVATTANKGRGQPYESPLRVGGYTYIKDSLVSQPGYKTYWDKKAKAPYLFNKQTRAFVTYENERSLEYKIKYVKKYRLAGVMFWQYSSDPKEYLLSTIQENLN